MKRANNALLRILDNNILTGPNFKDWLRNCSQFQKGWIGIESANSD